MEDAELQDKEVPAEPEISTEADALLKEIEETLPETLPQDSLAETEVQIDEDEL